ncbi:sulfate ABC transporter substrate-binding protein [Kushneria marisflavi]|uniref:Sulfate transporter subunit n=1 Tax=Kushneria marisflavi TaxID=157779 RepID=A0A240UNP7_9GAMM|nr:sulfate ABC transporter substrate-binding protein [Kushneria marisflavi]ART62745.1 sulfate transporter subunit [Kushneria marisflavi]RKD83847.1 sulfate transport system substrate-binding protein [Kushneria marisflavi]
MPPLFSVLRRHGLTVAVASVLLSGSMAARAENITLLNVSYDPTRELYSDYNQAFSEWYEKQSGDRVTVQQSHGGSGRQARSVIEGNPADVVTLALAADIDAIAEKGELLPPDWQKAFPDDSTPYTSSIVFLVRKGNPKNIHDWDDLIRDGVEVISPNPKTSGGARWNYLAAWTWALKRELGDLDRLHDPAAQEEVTQAQKAAEQYVKTLYQHVPVLDTGARAATNTFVQRGLGDVLLAWENEALLAINELGKDDYEIVTPSVSILAQPPVAVVEDNVKKKGPAAEKAAHAYLEHLYSPEGQQLAARHYYRPINTEGVDPELLEQFPKMDLYNINDVFGGWDKAQQTHFSNGGVFDHITMPGA